MKRTKTDRSEQIIEYEYVPFDVDKDGKIGDGDFIRKTKTDVTNIIGKNKAGKEFVKTRTQLIWRKDKKGKEFELHYVTVDRTANEGKGEVTGFKLVTKDETGWLLNQLGIKRLSVLPR